MVSGFVIGAASPSEHEYRVAKHHLYQAVAWDDPPDAGRYQAMADAVIADIHSRNKLPIVVGGTGLYLRALLFGLAKIPTIPVLVRERLAAELETEGREALFERLQSIDPIAARGISGGARNAQRVLRALEVAEHTGRPLSSYWNEQQVDARYNAVLIMPTFEPAALAERITERVDRMLHHGFVDEVRDLLSAGVDPGCRALKSLGYRELVEHIHGQISLEEARERIQRGHRRYARKQRTWFRAVDGVYRIDASRPDILDAAVEVLAHTELVMNSFG